MSNPPPAAEARPARRTGFVALPPEPLPRPTFWPGALAFAVTFLLWGIVSSPYITGVGVLLFVVSLAGWIGDLRHETRSH
jgi:hypothetical protein